MGRGVFAGTAGLLCLWFAMSAAGAMAENLRSVEQYGITWQFLEPARVGRYVTGDWWVVGPVTIQAISPVPTPGRNGSAVNPPAGKRQGYDDRIAGYEASLRATLPLVLQPATSR